MILYLSSLQFDNYLRSLQSIKDEDVEVSRDVSRALSDCMHGLVCPALLPLNPAEF
jgi:hypothetical protein